METLRWIMTVVVAGFAIGLAVYNWRFFFTRILSGDSRMSPAPWVAGFAGMAALWLCPVGGAFTYWWIPFVIDFGSIPNALWTAYSAATSKV